MPSLIDGVRRHADHLTVPHGSPATSQPLSQALRHEIPWLPRAGLEHCGRQFEIRHRGVHLAQRPLALESHSATVGRGIRR